MDIILLIAAFATILFGAELFTNGIEWFGKKLDLAEGAVGSVLAAVGTALPETMIPVVAILFAGNVATEAASHAVGVGAILGAPFMLATLAMFVTGVAVLSQSKRRVARDRMPVNPSVLGKDIRYFFVAYAIAVGVAFAPPGFEFLKPIAAVLLVVIYIVYVRAHFKAVEAGPEHELAPLRFGRFDPAARRTELTAPRMRIVSLQVVAALLLIIVGAVVFVSAVEHLAEIVGISPIIISLVVAPVATELPEKFNSVLWVRQGKDTLAMGNITGAMVFQSCLPPIIALLFAAETWTFRTDPLSIVTFASAGIAFASTAFIFSRMLRKDVLTGKSLIAGGAFYAAYLVLVGLYLAGVLGPVTPVAAPH